VIAGGFAMRIWAGVFTTLVMVGIIWFVQLVHYPLYALVGDARFTEYLKRHLAVTPRIVGPMILLECVMAVGMAWGVMM